MNKQIKVEPYDEYASGIPTDSIYIEDDSSITYSIQDLIDMLQKAKDIWGNVPVAMSDIGFESSHYNDTIKISQLYLYKKPDGGKFCVIESTP